MRSYFLHMSRPLQLSITPCIPCTSCGTQVPISRVGEHTCTPQGASPGLRPPPQSMWTPSPATATDDDPPGIRSLESSFEEAHLSQHSLDYPSFRNASDSRSNSSRASCATFASSIGRSASNASTALSSVSAGSYREDPKVKHVEPAGSYYASSHTRQYSASSIYTSCGQSMHSRQSSVSSAIVSREDAMYRAHPSCMEDRVKAPKPDVRLGHHRTVSSQDFLADLSAAGPSKRTPRTCRGCNQTIIGKAIRDGSGRLTGYWHKSCFTCTRCLAPFTTAEFFVLADKPYCEHDYHEMNGSLCSTCHYGIEGPCLETPQKQRYHPQCLRCMTCHISLDAGYLDLEGRVFCEQHGLATMQRKQLGFPSSLHRRTTRLLVV